MRFEGTGSVHPHEARTPGLPIEAVPPIIPKETVRPGPPERHLRLVESTPEPHDPFIERLMDAVAQHRLRQPRPQNGDRRGKR